MSSYYITRLIHKEALSPANSFARKKLCSFESSELKEVSMSNERRKVSTFCVRN